MVAGKVFRRLLQSEMRQQEGEVDDQDGSQWTRVRGLALASDASLRLRSYQTSSPPVSRNFPLGPCSRSATRTISAAPSFTVCRPLCAFRSVAVKPGLTEFTAMP